MVIIDSIKLQIWLFVKYLYVKKVDGSFAGNKNMLFFEVVTSFKTVLS